MIYLQDSYMLTEEYLEANNISVGILGHSRDSYEALLQPKEKFIGSVKQYKISSGLPRIFPARLAPQGKSDVKVVDSISQAELAKSAEKELHEEKKEDQDEEQEEIQIIVRSKEYYKELHKQRTIAAKKMWLKHKSIGADSTLNQSKMIFQPKDFSNIVVNNTS